MVNLRELQSLCLSSSNSSLNSNENTLREQTLYLGDLDLDMTEEQLFDYFNGIHMRTVKIAKQPFSSFAHVTFESALTARLLLEKKTLVLNSKVIYTMPSNHPTNFDANANLIIKNLESYLSEPDIVLKFKQSGDILSCKLVRGDYGESKCYAYLQFKSKASALDAIDKFNNTYWDEKCDPDFKYRHFQEMLVMRKSTHSASKLTESRLQEQELFADFNNKMGKKLYVGVFKKKDEYYKIKSDKEGKPSNLYVKNFGSSFGDRDLFNLFKRFGSIKSAKVRRLKVGLVEKPLGCGFVDFENPEDAEVARKALHEHVLESGRTISVAYADCKSRRMRKKLEESSNAMEKKTITNITFNIQTSMSNTPKSNMYDLPTTHVSNSTDESNSRFVQEHCSTENIASSRKTSFDTNMQSNEDSFSFTQFEWPDVWSKLLQSDNWAEYKLFP